jgi:hypothetical protein
MSKPKYWPAAFLLAISACDSGPPSDDAEDTAATAPEGTALCRRTQTFETPEECARFEEQYQALSAGVDAFVPDQSMREYETAVLRYAITRLPDSVQGEGGKIVEPVPDAAGDAGEAGMTAEEIRAVVEETSEGLAVAIEADPATDSVETRQIKMGRRMRACLDADPSFEVKEDKCQTIDTFEMPVAVWRWSVTPTEPGRHTLQVNTVVLVVASDGTTRPVPQIGKSARIEVEVTSYGRWKRFLDGAERWVRSPLGLLAALTALVGAIGLLIGAVRRMRKGDAPAAGGKPDKDEKP